MDGLEELIEKQYITHVHPAGGPFTMFKVNGEPRSRQKCISDIEAGTPYWTQSPEGDESKIHLYTVDGNTYLRTDRNEITEDNLGELPPFPWPS